jgi:hypothetical protein
MQNNETKKKVWKKYKYRTKEELQEKEIPLRGCLSLVSAVCCQVEVSAACRSLV